MRDKAIQAMAEKYKVSVPQLCIKYTLQLNTISIPKASSKEHIEDNMKLDFEIKEDDKEGVLVKEVNDSLENILEKYLDRDVTLIPCGGGDKIIAEREQWNDGSNTLCISPGVVVVYNRNNITNAVLRRYGIKVLEMPGSELSRGRGGPRCMSMPLIREDN